jgi:hypothetical protein
MVFRPSFKRRFAAGLDCLALAGGAASECSSEQNLRAGLADAPAVSRAFIGRISGYETVQS